MSSTRNKNQKSEYNLEKKKNEQYLNYTQNIEYGKHKHVSLMELGSNPHFRRDEIAKNHIDIDSMLKGIRSTNLEGPNFSVVPNNNSIVTMPWFDRPKYAMPEPFLHFYNERPNYLN